MFEFWFGFYSVLYSLEITTRVADNIKNKASLYKQCAYVLCMIIRLLIERSFFFLRATQRLAFDYGKRPKICKLKQISSSWVQNSSSILMGYVGVWDCRHLSVSAVRICHWAWFNKKLSKENWRTSQALDYLFNLKDKIESVVGGSICAQYLTSICSACIFNSLSR